MNYAVDLNCAEAVRSSGGRYDGGYITSSELFTVNSTV